MTSKTPKFAQFSSKLSLVRRLWANELECMDKRNAELIKMLASKDEVKKIIEHGTDTKISSLELVEACINGQIEIVKALVECNADINAREFGSYTYNEFKAECRPSKSKREYAYYSPLIISCYSKQTEVVKYLLSKECNLEDFGYVAADLSDKESENSHSRRRYDALHAACRRQNNQEIIDLLMEVKQNWKFEYITEEFDCDKDMIAYVDLKRGVLTRDISSIFLDSSSLAYLSD